MTWRGALLAIVLGAGLACFGFFAGYAARGAADSSPFGLLGEAYELLQEHYLGDLPDAVELQRGMVAGMLEEVGDPYTTLVEPASAELQSNDLAGEFGGIGASLSIDAEGRYRLIPFPDGPAFGAGVREGDILLAVDGSRIEPSSSMEAVTAALRGPPNTPVRVTVLRETSNIGPSYFDIRRALFPIPSVTSFLLPDDPEIGVLAITLFSDKTPEEVEQGYETLRQRSAKAFILDLRGNSGGLVDAAVEVARFFLADGIITTERRAGSQQDVIRVMDPGPASGMPLAVLVDGGTASAAELLAAALRDNRRAMVIGAPTFGKGSVQAVFELSDRSSLHVTVARWLTPLGLHLDEAGLQPDLEVTPSEGVDEALLAARNWLRSAIEGSG